MGRINSINSAVRSYDRKLFCEHKDGKLCVFRQSQRAEEYDVDGKRYVFIRPASHFVFALTHNWRLDGEPVEWGILPIQNRIRAIDLWNRDLAGECIDNTIKNYEAADRNRRNTTESFLYEFRSQFKNAFKDVNTANLSKNTKRGKY